MRTLTVGRGTYRHDEDHKSEEGFIIASDETVLAIIPAYATSIADILNPGSVSDLRWYSVHVHTFDFEVEHG